MYINYEYYRVFYYAAKCGNLTKAAALLQNSQPNLTRAIKTLEAELGCTLFSRTNRGLILTPAGRGRSHQHIRVAFAEIEAGEAAVTQSRTLERGACFSLRARARCAVCCCRCCGSSVRAIRACICASATIPRRRPSPPCMRRRRISPWSRRPPRSCRR